MPKRRGSSTFRQRDDRPPVVARPLLARVGASRGNIRLFPRDTGMPAAAAAPAPAKLGARFDGWLVCVRSKVDEAGGARSDPKPVRALRP